MAQREFDKQLAATLWERIQLSTSNHRLYPKQQQGGVLFVGYADFTVSLDGIPLLCLPGNSIKLMGDQLHFDPKAEKARDGSPRWFPLWFPVSGEVRAVLTEKLKVEERIVEMCHDAVAQVNQAAAYNS
ncbi:MAG: hypothetical protein GF334_07965 [Candidatus Altiarchaeales archaeon]|nr:hypothetical protein [Candidatus Altiarchaeales archaeon]